MILAPTLSASAGSGAAIVRPTFSRDFAGEKTLNNGAGPAITFTRASNATYFDANGVLQTASNDQPRFDHSSTGSLGLLIEEARTNSIRNSQAGGSTNGVIGSGGVMPTNWTSSVPTGVSIEVVGAGTVSGFGYIDIKISGTNTSGSLGFANFGFESSAQIVASSGQTWTASAYIALAAGAFTNVSTPILQIVGRDPAIVETSSISISTASSTLSRFFVTRTLNAGTTSRVWMRFDSSIDNGSAVNFTLRIAAPQLEQGAFPTSYIPTTTAAATRSADSAVVTPISSFYNQSEGTLFAEASSFGNEANATSASFSAADNANERFQLRIRGGSVAIVAGGVQSFVSNATDPATNVASRKCAAAAADNFAVTTNGGAVEADTSGAMPAVTHLLVGRLSTVSTTQFANGHIRKIAYYPRRLSNTLLQQLTT